VLARLQDLEAHFHVHGGDRQVHHDLDIPAREQFGDRPRRRDTERRCLGFGPVGVQVGHEPHVKVGERGEVLQVGATDGARADDTDTDRPAAHAACPETNLRLCAIPSKRSPA
jgi:hypothetical protein